MARFAVATDIDDRLAEASRDGRGEIVRPAERMRCEQDVLQLEEGTAPRQRLLFEDIESGAGDAVSTESVDKRGLVVVSDDTALIAAIDAALAEQPDVHEKIRDGKVQAAGAVIGAVMKAMQGKADAARVRELVLERAQA